MCTHLVVYRAVVVKEKGEKTGERHEIMQPKLCVWCYYNGMARTCTLANVSRHIVPLCVFREKVKSSSKLYVYVEILSNLYLKKRLLSLLFIYIRRYITHTHRRKENVFIFDRGLDLSWRKICVRLWWENTGGKKTREIGTEIFSWRKTTTFRGPSISSTSDFFSSPWKKK